MTTIRPPVKQILLPVSVPPHPRGFETFVLPPASFVARCRVLTRALQRDTLVRVSSRHMEDALQGAFTAALDALVEDLRKDRAILAALLCGSLSHDTVWAKSDIDLVLVTIDDPKVEARDIALNAAGVNVHAFLMPRTRFRQMVDGAVAHSFTHAFLAKGRLLYTHDPSIADLCARLQDLGPRDARFQLLGSAAQALVAIDKARKWFVTRGDLDYAALWVLFAAGPIARIEVIGRGLVADREVIPQAAALNPGLFKTIYRDLLNTKKTKAAVSGALDAVDDYIAERAPTLFEPVLAYLHDAGEARSASEIESHFSRHFDVQGVTTVCEYLADRGLAAKVSLPARLTRRSNADVQELAFFAVSQEPRSLGKGRS